MSSPMSISDFKAIVGFRGGFMHPNRFKLSFALPQVLQGGNGLNELAREVEFFCTATSLPGHQIQLNQVQRWTYGPAEQRPIVPIFMPLQCTFHSDAYGHMLQLFNIWIQSYLPHDWYTGGIASKTRYNDGGRQYELAYKKDYAVDLMLQYLDREGVAQMTYYFKEAFPVMVEDIPLDHGMTDTVAKFGVSFAYLDWTTWNDSDPT